MHAGDRAAEIGDRSNQRRPGVGWGMSGCPIVAARVETEGYGSVQSRNAAIAQIRFRDCAQKGSADGEQVLGRRWRSAGCWPPSAVFGLRPGQAEKGPRLVEDVAQVLQSPAS